MITIFGIFIVLGGIATLFLRLFIKNNPTLNWFSTRRSIQIILVGAALSVISGMFFYAEPGTS